MTTAEKMIVYNHPAVDEDNSNLYDDDDEDDDGENGGDGDGIVNAFNKPSSSSSSSGVNLNEVSWDNGITGDGTAITKIFDVPIRFYRAKEVRTICARLKVKGVNNFKKQEMLTILQQTYRTRIRSNIDTAATSVDDDDIVDDGNSSAVTEEIQCSFRLLNILFSDNFVNDLLMICHPDMVMNKFISDQIFWESVQAAFVQVDDNDEYDTLRFVDDNRFLSKLNIDCSKKNNHSWKKLKSMWKQVTADYREAYMRFSLYKAKDSNFFKFIDSKANVYYLRRLLTLRPNVNAIVMMESASDTTNHDTTSIVANGNTTNTKKAAVAATATAATVTAATVPATPAPTRTEKTTNPYTPIEEVVKNYVNSCVAQLDIEKQKLYFCKKDDNRKDMQCRVDDRKARLEEWEYYSRNIKRIRNEIKDEQENDVKVELLEDIASLKRKKREIGQTLGFY